MGNNLYSTPLNVPRTFYINSTLDPSEPEAAALGQPVKRILPFGQEAFNIYKANPMISILRLYYLYTGQVACMHGNIGVEGQTFEVASLGGEI